MQDFFQARQSFGHHEIRFCRAYEMLGLQATHCADVAKWLTQRRLKIRSREKRGMGSNPIIGTSEKAMLRGKFDENQRDSSLHKPTWCLGVRLHEKLAVLGSGGTRHKFGG